MKAKSSKVAKKRIISSVRASMDFGGLKPSLHAQRVGKDYLEGKISSQEAIMKIKEKHAPRFGR